MYNLLEYNCIGGKTLSLKDYTFTKKEDYIYYLGHLIILTSKYLNLYDNSINKLGILVNEMDLRKRAKAVVESEKYNDFSSMLGFYTNYLSNLIGDQANFALSYQNYRKSVIKNATTHNIAYVIMDQNQKNKLNEITTSRNWGNHVPVSLINATLEKATETPLGENLKLFSSEFEYYEGIWFIQMYDSALETLNKYKEIFELMKDDYSKLTGKKCELYKQTLRVRNYSDSKIPKISYDIQNKKIKTKEEVQREYEQE